MPNENNVQDRLDQAINGGTPQINPDEQRRYLGTFRERVALVIPVAAVTNPDAPTQVEALLKDHSDYGLLINGNLPQADQSPYLKIAASLHAKYTLKNSAEYGTEPEQAGIVVAAATAINVADVQFKATTETTAKSDKAPSFWHRLFHH
ncbi:YueI family protein [Fructilactobacillus myrtifloralis]|uniref:YueI family protein n=1 Tax=Fructilactobacillus myrtifloralis TaxID=2940301 RepID=A0ABY5BNA2_9LACO|nr:YueI family protein [Fructilactobacillus myrtifloralis]USS85155.1 YueI family protein [Fructilactobacillus myrtifloralis]